MKTTFSLGLALLALTSAQAQIFHPGGTTGAMVGRAAGAAGNASAPHNPPAGGSHGDYVNRHVPAGGYGRGYYGHPGYRGYDYGYGRGYWGPRYDFGITVAPGYGYYSGYGYGYPYYDGYGYYGSGAANGLLLGALAGGIIGNNSGEFRHNGWRGAAWGAGVGWLLGSIADANRRAYETTPVVVQPAPVQAQAQPAAASPQQVTIINNYYNSSTPMSAANGMFGR